MRHTSVPRRYTSATLTLGVAVAGVCFAVALATETVGADAGAGEMTDIAAVIEGLLALSPWAWAAAGAYVILVTPVIGILATAWEYLRVGDQRTVLFAFGVLAVLAISTAVAILR